MTIKHVARNRNWHSEKSYRGEYGYMQVKVLFEQNGAFMDALFTIKAFCVSELDKLFRAFCEARGIPGNCAYDVEIVKVLYDENVL